ncbi:hypothetical protein BD289DRAFT_439190 [Coniella lustricola]|uniref:Uncharacterized protein n=1 Tax=Coniella lustricola TaxID=2025994 RepID=A0A2T3A1Y0_9PEZI|nr:hypothetical protein BD289DRAFT_439190 [Coniella lustricola]
MYMSPLLFSTAVVRVLTHQTRLVWCSTTIYKFRLSFGLHGWQSIYLDSSLAFTVLQCPSPTSHFTVSCLFFFVALSLRLMLPCQPRSRWCLIVSD